MGSYQAKEQSIVRKAIAAQTVIAFLLLLMVKKKGM